MQNYDEVKHKYDTFICNYDISMVEDKETSFPIDSTYIDSTNHSEIEDWVWCRKESENFTFAFDSDAEREWANYLAIKIAQRGAAELTPPDEDDEHFLWGKNFPNKSEIKYEYYSDGIRKSYPDFVLKDKRGRIHIFEVKCINGNGSSGINDDEFKDKIEQLKKCYCAASIKLKNHFFYIPIKDGDRWKIFRFVDGNQKTMTKQELKDSFNE